MNVFIIPSWYPSKDNPISGIFFKEQAAYIAELFDDINVGVSLWGQTDPDLLINKSISSSFSNLINFLSQNNFTKTTSRQKNLFEIKTPTLGWTHKVLDGNISRIIEANKINLKKFEHQFGKVDIIHAHVSYPAGYVAMKLSRQSGAPYLITEHMGEIPFKAFIDSHGKMYSKLSKSIQEANAMVAVSPCFIEKFERLGLKKPEFIPNVVDEDFFTIESPVPVLPFKFFTLAGLSTKKGIDDLLHAIKIVIKKHDKICFSIGGGGVNLESYKAMTKELGLEKYIKWLGQLTRSEAKEQFQRCNAFVLPSHGETFGVVYAEAIASGKPIIATKCGGPECIVNEKNGLLAEVKNPPDLAEKILYLIENYKSFDSHVIRKDFEDRFSKKAVIPKIVEIYKSLVNEKV